MDFGDGNCGCYFLDYHMTNWEQEFKDKFNVIELAPSFKEELQFVFDFGRRSLLEEIGEKVEKLRKNEQAEKPYGQDKDYDRIAIHDMVAKIGYNQALDDIINLLNNYENQNWEETAKRVLDNWQSPWDR